LKAITDVTCSGSEELGRHEQCGGELVRLLLIAISAAKPSFGEVSAPVIQDGIDVPGQPVVPKLVGDGEFPEALVVDVGRISNSEYAPNMK